MRYPALLRGAEQRKGAPARRLCRGEIFFSRMRMRMQLALIVCVLGTVAESCNDYATDAKPRAHPEIRQLHTIIVPQASAMSQRSANSQPLDRKTCLASSRGASARDPMFPPSAHLRKPHAVSHQQTANSAPSRTAKAAAGAELPIVARPQAPRALLSSRTLQRALGLGPGAAAAFDPANRCGVVAPTMDKKLAVQSQVQQYIDARNQLSNSSRRAPIVVYVHVTINCNGGPHPSQR